jgi:RNA polymerase sigma-70 factor (ECF subfamily)
VTFSGRLSSYVSTSILYSNGRMSTYATALRNENPIPRREDHVSTQVVLTERSDALLIELVLAGDEFAFEKLFNRHKRFVAQVAGRYFRRPEQIDEVIQVCFAKAYFEFKNFRGVHDSSLLSWLGKITANTCLDILRNQKLKPENFISELSDPERNDLLGSQPYGGASAEDLIVNRDLAEKLLSCLQPEDRAVMQMLYLEGMSVAETADIMGWSLSKTKVRAWRTRIALRSVLRRLL